MVSPTELGQIAALISLLAEAIRDLNDAALSPDPAIRRRISDAASFITQAAKSLATDSGDRDGHTDRQARR